MTLLLNAQKCLELIFTLTTLFRYKEKQSQDCMYLGTCKYCPQNKTGKNQIIFNKRKTS